MTDNISTNPSRVPGPQDDFDFGALLRVIYRQKWFVIASGVVCGAIGLALSLSSPRIYQADVSVLVQGAANPTNFRPFLENRKLASEVIKELGLGQPPYSLSPTTLFGSVVKVENIRGTSVFSISAELPDPDLVTRLVNRIAERAIDAATRVYQQSKVDSAERARADIKLQLDDARVRYDAAEAAYNSYRQQAQIDVLRKDAELAISGHAKLLDIDIEIATEKAKLEEGMKQLEQRERRVQYTRTLNTGTLLMAAARSDGDLGGVQLKDELPNAVWVRLDGSIAASRTLLAALERQKAELVQARKLDGPRIAQVAAMYAAEVELGRLQGVRDVAKDIWGRLNAAYENARLPVATETVPLSIINAAIPPDRGLARNTPRSTLLGFFAGLTLALVVVFVRGAFLETQSR